MVEYDSSVIITFAERLYEQAGRIVALYTVIGVVVGGALGAALSIPLHSGAVLAIVCAGVIGAAAFAIGQQKAFALRLQAQTALCQVQIESNTRS